MLSQIKRFFEQHLEPRGSTETPQHRLQLAACALMLEVARMDQSVSDDELNVVADSRSEEHTSELQSRPPLVCRLLLEKKKKKKAAGNGLPNPTLPTTTASCSPSTIPSFFSTAPSHPAQWLTASPVSPPGLPSPCSPCA